MAKKEIKTEWVKISEVKPNPSNPRLIKDDKFHKLVQSIKELPEMLEIRPIVVNEDMIILGGNMRLIIKELTPNIWEKQKNIFDNHVNPKWRFGNLWTSSISNYNISAPFHRDAGNIEGCVNVIIAKKKNATGGNTTVPDYNATMDSCDNSMLVYPAWKNLHGVTPIVPTHPGGYRNSLVFYPLKAFVNLK